MNNNYLPIIITIFCLSVLLVCTSMLKAASAQSNDLHPIAAPKKFITYYGDSRPDDEFANYDIIVFDRQNHPQLSKLNSKGKIILGYLSGGEIEQSRDDFKVIKNKHVLLEENKNWKGDYSVDVRNPAWSAYVIEEIIPDILRKGFDGIFIDTIDSVEILEVRDPKKYSGMIQGAANMIKTIRMHYPNIKIMVNRGYKVLPYVAQDIDYVLHESVLANYNFETGKSELFPDNIYKEYLDITAQLKQKAPQLQFMSLDYWDMNDVEGVKHIYNKHRENGFAPYVTTVDLQKVHHHPW